MPKRSPPCRVPRRRGTMRRPARPAPPATPLRPTGASRREPWKKPTDASRLLCYRSCNTLASPSRPSCRIRSQRLQSSQEQIPAAVAVNRPAVTEIQRAYWRIRSEKQAARLEGTRKRAWDQRRPIFPEVQREPGIDAFEQLLPHELVIVNQPAEGNPIGSNCAGRIAGLLQESSPLEQVVAREGLAAELAACLEPDAQRVITERPRADAVGVPFVVGIGGAKRTARSK